jgi:hypothetical protein
MLMNEKSLSSRRSQDDSEDAASRVRQLACQGAFGIDAQIRRPVIIAAPQEHHHH